MGGWDPCRRKMRWLSKGEKPPVTEEAAEHNTYFQVKSVATEGFPDVYTRSKWKGFEVVK